MKMKNKIFALILLLLTVVVYSNSRFADTKEYGAPFWGGDVLNIISDEAVTSSNDSLESAWYEVTGYTNVEFMIFVDDTASVSYQVDYSFGTMKSETGTGGYLTVAGVGTDSIVTTGSALTGKIKGVIVRGIGTSAVTNLIPGASYVRFRAYRTAYSGAYANETTIKVVVGIKRTS